MLPAVIDLVWPFLYEEERVLTIQCSCTLCQSYQVYLVEVKQDFLLMQWWENELAADESRERSLMEEPMWDSDNSSISS